MNSEESDYSLFSESSGPKLNWLMWVVAALLGVIIVSIIVPTVAWDGAVAVSVKVTVLDAETDAPIAGALVILGERAVQEYTSLTDTKDKELFLSYSKSAQRTDSTGVCLLINSSRAGGGSGLFGRSGNFYLDGPLLIKAEKHREFRGLIQNSIGRKKFSLSENKQQITVYLESPQTQPTAASSRVSR